MRKGNVFNKNYVIKYDSYKTLKKELGFGFNYSNLKKISYRFEFFFNLNQFNKINKKKLFFFNYLFSFIPSTRFFRDQYELNIIFLDIINSYRGYRHFRSLPTRGQRT